MTDHESLLTVLPHRFISSIDRPESAIEFILDLDRPFMVRYDRHTDSGPIVRASDIAEVTSRITAFDQDNRAGIDGTLHRVSRLVDRNGEVLGLTCRIGRTIEGTSGFIASELKEGNNVLILGAPGRGKTTMLRDSARYLSEELGLTVMIVDGSNEIAGAGRVPHASVGTARRLQVPKHRRLAQVMIEAVENHMPDVVIVDEISNADETDAIRTLVRRGVQVVATAHGRQIQDIVHDPDRALLVGGITTVTLTDDESIRRGTPKTISERKFEPCFDTVVELYSFDTVGVWNNVPDVIDAMLLGTVCDPEERRRLGDSVRTLREQKIRILPVRAEPPTKPGSIGERLEKLKGNRR